MPLSGCADLPTATSAGYEGILITSPGDHPGPTLPAKVVMNYMRHADAACHS
jgi:hypothetical protein